MRNVKGCLRHQVSRPPIVTNEVHDNGGIGGLKIACRTDVGYLARFLTRRASTASRRT